jgi:hypothetical protein
MMHMRWIDLAFLHWPLAPQALRPHIPAGLTLDTFDGQAWIGIVPFYMTNTRPRFVPPMPGVSSFAELNVRTYVTVGGKAGVWFFSLDAASRLAVRGARWSFCLPYFDAHMSVVRQAEAIEYRSRRTHRGAPAAEFAARYWPKGAVYLSQPGSLEHWLTERYCLYSAGSRGQIWRGEIHHPQWPLQPGEAEITVNRMTEQIGVTLPAMPPLVHFVQRIDVVAWWPERTVGSLTAAGAPRKCPPL